MLDKKHLGVNSIGSYMEACIKMQIEIYTSYIVCDLVLDGYGVTCIKMQIEIYTSYKKRKGTS